jgi:hypothetical protein
MKLRARGEKPCHGCPDHKNVSASSESRDLLRIPFPQPYLIHSRATCQPGCLTPQDFFYVEACNSNTFTIIPMQRGIC